MVLVFFSSWLGVLSDWKNFSLDSRVLVAVTDVRGAGVGTVVVDAFEVMVETREAVGLDRKDAGDSLGADVMPDVGWEEGEVENLLGV